MRGDPLFILGVLAALIIASEWLVRHTPLRHIGTALLVIVLGAIVANLGVIPAGSTPERPVPLYDAIFGYIAPISIFWLLLSVNLRDVAKAGIPLIALFLIGALGTVAGVVAGMLIVQGATSIGPMYAALAGMFAGTYTGGSVNFNALALHYNVTQNGALYGGSVVADNIITTVWMVATLSLPRLLAPLWPRRGASAGEPIAKREMIVELAAERETVDPAKLAVVIALGVGGLWISMRIASALGGAGIRIPTVLIVTTIALVLAQSRVLSRLPGARALAMVGVYAFLAVIGAHCDVSALNSLGTLGLVILALATITVLVHGVVTFGAARLFRMDLDGAAVASQANIGGSTSALALAKSLGREDLLLPGILLGAVGNAIGTFLGFWTVSLVSMGAP